VNLQLSGLPALAIQIGFILVFSAPVWLALGRSAAVDRCILRLCVVLRDPLRPLVSIGYWKSKKLTTSFFPLQGGVATL
jgi:hypothetical protein